MTPDNILSAMAATFASRNQTYSDGYRQFGAIMFALFPGGIHAETPEELTRLGVVVMIVSKLARFATSGATHVDSVHDLGVYAAMMESLLSDENDHTRL